MRRSQSTLETKKHRLKTSWPATKSSNMYGSRTNDNIYKQAIHSDEQCNNTYSGHM